MRFFLHHFCKIGSLHIGQISLFSTHSSIHFAWNIWPHYKSTTSLPLAFPSPSAKSSKQIAQPSLSLAIFLSFSLALGLKDLDLFFRKDFTPGRRFSLSSVLSCRSRRPKATCPQIKQQTKTKMTHYKMMGASLTHTIQSKIVNIVLSLSPDYSLICSISSLQTIPMAEKVNKNTTKVTNWWRHLNDRRFS